MRRAQTVEVITPQHNHSNACSRLSANIYVFTIASFIALILLLMAWFCWLSPPYHVPIGFVLIVFVAPLTVPLSGLLHGKLYTYRWVSMLILFYFCHGVGTVAANPSALFLGIGEIIFSLNIYIGSIAYVRIMSKYE